MKSSDDRPRRLIDEIRDGYVVDYDYSRGTYTVNIDSTTVECRYSSFILARMLGIQSIAVLPPGTEVKVALGDKPCILAAIWSNPADGALGDLKSVADGDTPDYHNNDGLRGGVSPDVARDFLEGELDLSNALGVGLQLLGTFARLSGGARAYVEALAVNDMVRVVSEVFRTHTSFGDHEEYNDGRLNSVTHGTSYQAEAMGAGTGKELGDPKLLLENGIVDVDAADKQGAWRYSKFVGFLGDMVHMFVTQPEKVLQSTAEESIRSGKARLQMMSDGTILGQSVTEIAFEKVTRIPVPRKKKEWDDPTGMLASELESLDAKFLKIWRGYGRARQEGGIASVTYQLREYARWLSSYHSMARFLQNPKDYEVPSEAQTPRPSWKNNEQDVEDANEDIEDDFYDTYACMRIMRDGSVVHWSGDGSSVVMSDGNVQWHASRHLELSAAGDIRCHAGRDIVFTARRHMNITAVLGGLKIKARTFLDALSERGRLWLKSDANPDVPYEPPEGAPAAEIATQGVLIESSGAGIQVEAARTISLDSRQVYSSEDPRAAVSMSGGLVLLEGQKVWVNAQRDIALKSPVFLHSALQVIGDFQSLRYKNMLSASRGNNQGNGVLLAGTLSEQDTPFPPGAANQLDRVMAEIDFDFSKEPRDGLVWKYPDTFLEAPLGWSAENCRETLTEQYLRLDNPHPDAYGTWTPTLLSLLSGPGTERSTFVTPEETLMLKHDGGENLREPSNKPAAGQSTGPQSYKPRAAQWAYLK